MDEFLFDPGVVQGFGDLLDDVQGLVDGDHALALQYVLHRLAVDVLHGEVQQPVVLAHGVGLDDVRVVQLGGGARLLDEERHELGVVCVGFGEDLQRGGPVERDLVGQVHGAHPALADGAADDEVGDHGSAGEARRRHLHHAAAVAALHHDPGVDVVDGHDPAAG